MCRNGDPILPRKKTLLAKSKVAGHLNILATKKKKKKKKKEWGKVMPGDAVTPNAGPGLLLNCLVKVQNSYKTLPLPMVRMDF